MESLIRHASGLYKMVTHVFLDNVEEWCASPRFRLLVKKTEGKEINFLYHKTLLDMVTGKDDYLAYWKIEDYFPIQTPHMERAWKRTVQDGAGSFDNPHKARRYEDVEEVTSGRKVIPERRVVVFNKEWDITLDKLTNWQAVICNRNLLI